MKCEICKCRLLSDCQFINGKYYHNKCIEKLIEQNQKYKEVIENAIQFIKDTCIEQIPDMPQGCYRETASIGDLEELLAILEDKEVE